MANVYVVIFGFILSMAHTAINTVVFTMAVGLPFVFGTGGPTNQEKDIPTVVLEDAPLSGFKVH